MYDNNIYVKYQSIILEIKATSSFINSIIKHFPFLFIYSSIEGEHVSFCVEIDNFSSITDAKYHHIVNRSLNNASLDCWIDTKENRCVISNIMGKSENDKHNLVNFFCSNLFEKLIEREGFNAIHCSCVERNGRIVAFVGERMSGKTTAELILIENGYNLVANDCALFKFDPLRKKIDVVGVIENVFIREQSKYYKRTMELCEQNKILVKKVHEKENNKERLVLTHKELAEINNSIWTAKGILHSVVFTKFNTNNMPLKTERIWDSEENIIKKQCIEIGHESTDFLNDYFYNHNYSVDVDCLMEAMREIPRFYCGFNEDGKKEFCEFVNSIMENEY